jgi:hypothetical protein
MNLSDTSMISKARQGNGVASHIDLFATLARSGPEEPGKKRKACGASKATAFEGKTCDLCSDGDDGPGYDLWHVLRPSLTRSANGQLTIPVWLRSARSVSVSQ